MFFRFSCFCLDSDAIIDFEIRHVTASARCASPMRAQALCHCTPIESVLRLTWLTCLCAGNNCTFVLQAPVGFTARLTMQYLILGESDTLQIVSGEEFPSDDKYQRRNGPAFDKSNMFFDYTGPRGGGKSNSSKHIIFTKNKSNYHVSISLIPKNLGGRINLLSIAL